MKRLIGLVITTVILALPYGTTQAETDYSVGTDDEYFDSDAYSDEINDDSDPSSENSLYAYNDVDDTNDTPDRSSQPDYFFDSGFKKLAYNTPEYRGPSSKSTFIFDPARLRWYAYDRSGELVGSGRASGGKSYCPDIRRRCTTPVGSYSVYSIGGPGCVSKKYPIGRGGAPMPYCMFFHGGYAIHGSYDVPNHNASHGCIRVQPAAARWLARNLIEHGTRVIVRPYR